MVARCPGLQPWPSSCSLKEEPQATSLGVRKGSQLAGAAGSRLNGSSQFCLRAKPLCRSWEEQYALLEHPHLCNDTQGPYHLLFSLIAKFGMFCYREMHRKLHSRSLRAPEPRQLLPNIAFTV